MPFLVPTLDIANPLFVHMITAGFYDPPHRGGGSRPS